MAQQFCFEINWPLAGTSAGILYCKDQEISEENRDFFNFPKHLNENVSLTSALASKKCLNQKNKALYYFLKSI